MSNFNVTVDETANKVTVNEDTGSIIVRGVGVQGPTGAAGGAPDWGDIGGTLSDQTDLQTALNAKQDLDSQLTSVAGLSYAGNSLKVVRVNSGENGFELATQTSGVTDHTALTNIGTNTHAQIDTHIGSTSNPHSVTKTQVGLSNVVNADTTTTANITDSSNKRFVTDANLTTIGNQSGTNTGDQTASTVSNTPAGNIAATNVQAALNELDSEKVQANGAITGATKTKITYDAKGLVASGSDATTADIADSSNKRYVTDAQLTVIGNTSGTNTGDQDLSGYELLSNKDTDGTLAANSDTKYPSQKATKTYADTKQTGSTKLTDIAALSYASNALKVIRVNAGETAYELAAPSGGGTWGSITGTLSSQTDLQSALDAKLAKAGGTMTGSLILAAGTASASTAPAKLQSGTSMTTPENGAIEYDGSNVFITIGGTRFTFTRNSATQTLSNKRLTPRMQSVSSSATVTPNADDDDIVVVTAQAAGLTLANWSGTPVAGQAMIIRVKDNGTARSITFDSQYRAFGVSLPTTTTISKTLYISCIWNAVDTKIDVLGVVQEV